jgi:hypothetical protein
MPHEAVDDIAAREEDQLAALASAILDEHRLPHCAARALIATAVSLALRLSSVDERANVSAHLLDQCARLRRSLPLH